MDIEFVACCTYFKCFVISKIQPLLDGLWFCLLFWFYAATFAPARPFPWLWPAFPCRGHKPGKPLSWHWGTVPVLGRSLCICCLIGSCFSRLFQCRYMTCVSLPHDILHVFIFHVVWHDFLRFQSKAIVLMWFPWITHDQRSCRGKLH